MAQPGTPLTPMQAMTTQLWAENPIFRQVLGICSALAVTNLVFNTVLMCLGLIWATTMSSLTISLMREWIPQRIRIMVQVLVIAVYVMMVDIAFRAFFYETHAQIAAYVGLIITNCIVLGRLEAFSMNNRVLSATMDGFGAGLGYSFILLAVAIPREILGFGTILGDTYLEVRFFDPEVVAEGAIWQPWIIMVTPAGAFFVLGIIVWIMRTIALRREEVVQSAMPGQAAKGGAK